MQNVLARAAILTCGRLMLPEDLAPQDTSTQPSGTATSGMGLKEILAETERRVIRQALEQEGWNRTRAAQALGISRRQLFDKIHQHNLHP
jgi:DNA-binding NtrC family response regulator